MRQEKLIRLLCELIKNSRRSDRDLAKILGFSQPSVSRLRKILEKDAILQYTAIPNFSYLGFDLIVFTLYRMKESLQPLREKAESWLKKQPNVVFSSEGQGMEADRVMISVHRDYADFSEFHQKFRRELGPHFESFKTFLVSLRGNEILRLFTFNDLAERATPNFSVIDSQRRRWKRSIPSNLLKAGSVLDFRERESTIATYTSAADKMKVFSAFIREGLENGDSVTYVYPDEESGTVRTKLKEHGIDVEEYEKDETLHMESLSEYFMTNGKLDFEKAVTNGLNWWAEARRKGYNHARTIGDIGDFSFVNGQWQKYIDYWLDSRWNDPNVSEWVESKKPEGVVYSPFLMEITAINVEHMSEAQVHKILKAFGEGKSPPTRFIDLLEYVGAFSKRISLSHRELLGRKLLLEFDPTSNYETTIEDFAKESMANVEPIYVFTSTTSPIHKRLAKYLAVKFFLMSISTSAIQSKSENEVFIPANNIDLILDSIDNVTKAYPEANVSIVFDGLSDLLSSLGPERTFTFLRHALQILSSERTTALFLLNTSAHDPKIVSRLRSVFYNQLVYRKVGLQAVKLSKIE
jgi:DNA-binding Lrp family transcriptional regulator